MLSVATAIGDAPASDPNGSRATSGGNGHQNARGFRRRSRLIVSGQGCGTTLRLAQIG